MNGKRKVEVIPYDKEWNNEYYKAVKVLSDLFSENFVESHHIGSTAIIGLMAKPVIDILVVVKKIDDVDLKNSDMSHIGYEAKGENGISGRRFFIKGGNNRTHHIHCFQEGNKEIKRHINFRDYMIAHPTEAEKYAELKRKLSEKYTYDISSYVEGKNDYIREIDRKAEEWVDKEYPYMKETKKLFVRIDEKNENIKMNDSDFTSHIRYLNEIAETRFFIGGGFEKQEGGMIIFEANNVNEAKSICDRDPIIFKGIYKYSLLQWKTKIINVD